MSYPVSAAFMKAVRSAYTVVQYGQWSIDGVNWMDLPVTDGTINCDRTSNTRWAANVNIPAQFPLAIDSESLHPYGPRVRLFKGIRLPRIGPEYVPWGVYRVDGTKRVSASDSQLTLVGREKAIIDSRFLVPRQVGGAAAITTVNGLVLEAVPDATFNWLSSNPNQVIPSVVEPIDRWGILDASATSIGAAIGGEMYFDGRGVFTVQDVPSVANAIDWVIDDDVRGVITQLDEEQTRDGVYNVVVANGESSTGAPPVGPGIAWDNDPASPTYAGPDPLNHPELAGPFGVVARFYTSALLTTNAACSAAAAGLLSQALGLQSSLEFTLFSNPALLAGDVVLANGGRHLVDSWSAEWRSATMDCTTRSAKVDLGDVTDDDANE